MNVSWQDALLDRGELYEVGGAVRDAMLGLPASPDRDYVVRGIAPTELEAILAQFGVVHFVGKSFGVFKFSPQGSGQTVDIALPRTETSVGPRHTDFNVTWDPSISIEDDLRRRDFTINAMALNLGDHTVVDPTNGRADLSAGILREVFPRTFEQDPLRILRGVRFAARFDLRWDDTTEIHLRDGIAGLEVLSAERVRDEIDKLLTQARNPSTAFSFLQLRKGLAYWLPELDRCAGVEQNQYHPDDVFWHSLKSCDAAPINNLLVRWAALLHDTGKVDARTTVDDARGERVVFYGHEFASAKHTRAVMARLRYPTSFAKACERLVTHHMFNYQDEWNDSTVRRFMRRVGTGHLVDLFLLREADCKSRNLTDEVHNLDRLRRRIQEETERASALSREDLAIDGDDVVQITGLPPGPELGEWLERALEWVLDDPARNTHQTLSEWLRRESARL